MLELTKLLSTLQGKLIAGVVVTSLAAAAGVAAVQTVNTFSASDQAASNRAAGARTSTSANSPAGDRIAGNSSGTAKASASGSAKSGSGTSASGGYTASAPGILGSARVNANSGVAVITPAIPGSKPVGPGGTPTNGGGTSPSGPGSVQAPTVNTPEAPAAPSVEPEIPAPPGLGTPVPAPPSATLPTGVAVYESGTYSVVVPGTAGDDQKLCLSGTLVNRCRTIKVPATKSVTLTISYTGNASASAPTFTVNRCERGLQIGANGLTPGTNVKAQAEGSTLSADLSSSEVGQTASFCKA